MLDLNRKTKVTRSMDGVAAGTSDQNGTGIDMQGHESITFIAAVGTLTATQVTSLKAQQSDDDGSSDAYSDILGSDSGGLADGDSDKLIVLTVVRPAKRWVRPVLLRGTANAVIDGIVAIQHPAHKTPTTHATSVAKSETVVSPIEGTA